nr:MAG TPA: hypothetical protein [Caudoviricetes sp.]
MMTSASGRSPLRMYERIVGTARPRCSATAAVPRYLVVISVLSRRV